MATDRTAFLLDTGPLSTLCSFPRYGTLYLHTVLQYVDIVLSDGVVIEAGKGKIWRTIAPLLKNAEIQTIQTPVKPEILDKAYSRDLGAGERSTIKVALDRHLPVVIDDKDAFVVANRFGLQPIGFQDFIMKLVREHHMTKETALEIITASANQYPRTFLIHTLEMLNRG